MHTSRLTDQVMVVWRWVRTGRARSVDGAAFPNNKQQHHAMYKKQGVAVLFQAGCTKDPATIFALKCHFGLFR